MQIIKGYASLFNVEDSGSDTVLPGAFTASLSKRGAADIQMLLEHDPGQSIGVWEQIREDARGLYVQGRIIESIPNFNGLSIGFRTRNARYNPHNGGRYIEEIELWEISIVPTPMLPDAIFTRSEPYKMTLPEWVKPGAEFVTDFGEDNSLSGRVYHVRAIVDGRVVLRKWRYNEQDWQYSIADASKFAVIGDCWKPR